MWTPSSSRASKFGGEHHLPQSSSRRSRSRSAGCCSTSKAALSNASGDERWMDAYRFFREGVRALLRASAWCRASPCRSSSAPTGRASWRPWATSPALCSAYEILTRVLPGGDLPRHHAVRLPQGAELAAHDGDRARRLRHDDVGLLDPRPELLDAQRPRATSVIDGVVHATELVGDRVQPPPCPYRLVQHAAGFRASPPAFPWWPASRPGVGCAATRSGGRDGGPCAPGVFLAAALIPLQILAGDMHGLNTLEHQPAQGRGPWRATGRPAANVPLVLFALPDQEARQNRFEIAIPNGGEPHPQAPIPAGVVPGLKRTFRRRGRHGEAPRPSPRCSGAFRIMVGVGMLMLAVSWATSYRLWRRGETGTLLGWALVAMTFSGWGRDHRRLVRHRDRPPALASSPGAEPPPRR